MFWCLRGGSCRNRGFPRITRIAWSLARVRKNRLNQDLQDKRTRPIQPPQPQQGGMCIGNRSHHSLEPQRGDMCYRLNRGFSKGNHTTSKAQYQPNSWIIAIAHFNLTIPQRLWYSISC